MVKPTFKFNIVALALFLIFVGLIVYGLIRGEFTEVFNNASILCLSCIGIE